jgi:hypothetical protein
MSCAIISQELVITNNVILASLEATNIIIGGGTCADATAVAKDSVGDLISTTNIPSGASSNIIIPNSGVQVFNTDSSFVENFSVRADSSFGYAIPNTPITVKDQSGNTLASESVPSAFAKEIVVTAGSGSQILNVYPYALINTTSTIQYSLNDDKWFRDNVINPEIATWPTNKEYVYPSLDVNNNYLLRRGANPDGSGNNIFGNLERFTDENGLQVYGNDYIIDHYLGFGYSLFTPITSTDWDTGLIELQALTKLGFSDWTLPNLRHLQLLYTWAESNPLSILMLKISAPATTSYSSSTTRSNFTSQCMGIQSLLRSGFVNKASALTNMVICRKAFTYNATSGEMELT